MSGKSDTPQSFYNAIFKTFDRIPMVMGPNNDGKSGYGLPTAKKSHTLTLKGADLEIFKKIDFKRKSMFTKASILNLFNNSYEGLGNRPMPGRAFYLTFVFKFT